MLTEEGLQERVAAEGFSHRPRGIKGSFDGTLPRMSALCGVYARITTVKYGGCAVKGERCKGQGDEHWPMFAIAAFAVIERSYCLVFDNYTKLLFTPTYVIIVDSHCWLCKRIRSYGNVTFIVII